MERGTIYAETVIHSAPEAFLADAPYQLVIVSLEAGGRRTGRMRPGDARVKIGDAVHLVETDEAGISWFAEFAPSASPRGG